MSYSDENHDLLSRLLQGTRAGERKWDRLGMEDQFIHHLPGGGAVVIERFPEKAVRWRHTPGDEVQSELVQEGYQAKILNENGELVSTLSYREPAEEESENEVIKDLFKQVRENRPRDEGNGKKKHEPTNKYRETVHALNRRTQRGEMAWTRHDEDPRSGRSRSIIRKEEGFEGEYYTASYKNKKFLLYNLYQGERPRDMEGWRKEIEPGSRLERRLNRPILQILDENDEQIFEFPPFDVLEDLYDTVRSKTNEEVETFLNEFLAGEGET